MYNKMVTNDIRGRKKCLKYASKSRTSLAESEKAKLHIKLRKKSKMKHSEYRTSSSEKSKQNLYGTLNDDKVELYKTMKRMLEKKYKQVTSKNDSDEKLFLDRKLYDPKVYNMIPEKNGTFFSEKLPIKTSSMSETNTTDVDSRSVGHTRHVKSKELPPKQVLEKKIEAKPQKLVTSKTDKLQKRIVTKQKNKAPPEEASIEKRKLDKQFPGLKSFDGKKLQKNKEAKQNRNSPKMPEKQTKQKISKRLAILAQHREIPCQLKKDMTYNPFKVPKRALLFRERPCKLKPGSNEKRSKTLKKGHQKNLNKVHESNKQNFGHYRKRRITKTSKYHFTTPRLLELAKPVIKSPPMSFLSPEEVFTVKKRSLKAKCSKRVLELAYPVMRAEDLRIKADYPSSIKRRALRARCTRRVKELAKPLARRCRSSVRKKGEERAEG